MNGQEYLDKLLGLCTDGVIAKTIDCVIDLLNKLRVEDTPVTAWVLREIIHDRLNRRVYE